MSSKSRSPAPSRSPRSQPSRSPRDQGSPKSPSKTAKAGRPPSKGEGERDSSSRRIRRVRPWIGRLEKAWGWANYLSIPVAVFILISAFLMLLNNRRTFFVALWAWLCAACILVIENPLVLRDFAVRGAVECLIAYVGLAYGIPHSLPSSLIVGLALAAVPGVLFIIARVKNERNPAVLAEYPQLRV
ncbi:unnamed protein product [Vitrella brassicaformis CCMP3155]|uniref:Uncharacterized protein n=1 Tax=Vitrella brassicaformis (strain CCMP3155) TaxID=1169540 RepID=A0A0G4EUV2_VITBC|nr:unnamed protein product [Vitrella brassicaformis CCMP3155]|eukprot:CEM02111.1 unnamed protein product [Vitrella brassicaformis CCMP3155]